MDRLPVVSIIRGPRIAVAQMTDPSALIKVNGDYLHLDKSGLLMLARLMADNDPQGIDSVEGHCQQPVCNGLVSHICRMQQFARTRVHRGREFDPDCLLVLSALSTAS